MFLLALNIGAFMKTLLSISSSDPTGKIGIQADIKTAESLGVHCATILTALHTQAKSSTNSILELSSKTINSQLEIILENLTIDAIKIGMIYDIQTIDTIRYILSNFSVPTVFNPLLTKNLEQNIADEEALRSIKTLFPYVTLILLNAHEADRFFGEKLKLNTPCPVLVQDSHKNLKGVDTLYYANNSTQDFYPKNQNTNEASYSFSATIAASLALGKGLEESIVFAKEHIFEEKIPLDS